MHLTRYPQCHASLLQYSLKSYSFIYTGCYTSFQLALGFTEHTRNYYYLFDSMQKSIAVSILLINSGANTWVTFLGYAYDRCVLKQILVNITTDRIIDMKRDYDPSRSNYKKVHACVDRVLASRGIN